MLYRWTLVTKGELFKILEQVRDIIGCVIVKENSSSRFEHLISMGCVPDTPIVDLPLLFQSLTSPE